MNGWDECGIVVQWEFRNSLIVRDYGGLRINYKWDQASVEVSPSLEGPLW